MDSNPPPSHSSSYASFPIVAISILGILTTAILLLSYYIFVTKCCLGWHHSDILLFRFSPSARSRRRALRHQFNPTVVDARRGLDTSTINSIPTFRFARAAAASPVECAVCLADLQDQELLRVLPNCSHSFHVDCVDTWLQSNTNCPLCRAEIRLAPMQRFSHTPRRPTQRDSNPDVVIEVRDNAAPGERAAEPRNPWHMKSMGDECIDTREKDERFVVRPPIRRSFSVNSSDDRQLFLSVRDVLRQHASLLRNGEGCSGGGDGGSRRIRRPLFSFGRSFRSAASVLPLQGDL